MIPRRSRSESRTVLVVEAEGTGAASLKGLLDGTTCQVDAASDGWQALRMLTEGRFDLAMLDLDCHPVHGVLMTGWDLARLCRARNPAVPIVAVSSGDDAELAERVERLKAAVLVQRPLEPERLGAAIRRLGLEWEV